MGPKIVKSGSLDAYDNNRTGWDRLLAVVDPSDPETTEHVGFYTATDRPFPRLVEPSPAYVDFIDWQASQDGFDSAA